MLIHVHYPDNRFDYVKDSTLHGLIESGAIARFKRSSGWVVIGVDPLREARRNINSNLGVKYTPAVGEKNAIGVVYNDNRYAYVSDETLDALLEANVIVKFQRTTGWVTVGVDPVRPVKHERSNNYPHELKKRAIKRLSGV